MLSHVKSSSCYAKNILSLALKVISLSLSRKTAAIPPLIVGYKLCIVCFQHAMNLNVTKCQIDKVADSMHLHLLLVLMLNFIKWTECKWFWRKGWRTVCKPWSVTFDKKIQAWFGTNNSFWNSVIGENIRCSSEWTFRRPTNFSFKRDWTKLRGLLYIVNGDKNKILLVNELHQKKRTDYFSPRFLV